MVKFAKYLSICVIVASSRFIGATNFPAEDCDDKDTGTDYFSSGSAHSSQFLVPDGSLFTNSKDKETGTDYFSSGSAHSSQFMMPDGSVLTNSKGSSISSDGIKRTFQELKKEANEFVSKSSDGLAIPSRPIIPQIPGSNFSPFFNKNAFSTGQQSSFSSSQSGSSGSSQYFDQQPFPQVPADSKITTFKKHEVKKFVTKSASGLSSNPEVTGEFDAEQNQGAKANANVETFIYKPAGAAFQNGYSNNHHQESASIKVSSSGVNPAAGTVQQTVLYHPVPLKLYEREDAHGSEGTRVSSSNLNTPLTYGGKTIIYPSVPQSGASSSSSSSSSKFESYSQRHDANADIPSYLANNKQNTFTTNVLDFNKIQDLKIPKIHSLPDIIPTGFEPITRENHYASESHKEHSEQKETKNYAVPVAPVVPKLHNHINDNEEVESHRPEEWDGNVNKPVILSSEKIVAVPNTDGRHTRFQIKVQAPTETVGSSQTYRKETHSQSVKAFSSDGGTDSAVLSESFVPKDDNVRPVPLGTSQSQVAKHFEENAQKSGDTIQIPILVHGVPQNTGYSSKSSSSSSQSFSSGSQLGEFAGGSQTLKYAGGGTTFDAGTLFGNSDKFSIPVQTYVSPVQTYVSPVQTYVSPQSSSKSSSSSSYHYFSSNGQAGEQLVPNSNIFANSDGSLHQSHGSLLKNLGKTNIGSDTEFVSSSFGAPQKKTYGISTAYSSQSSNINGKVTENREAAVAVDDNGKIDSYHVKS